MTYLYVFGGGVVVGCLLCAVAARVILGKDTPT